MRILYDFQNFSYQKYGGISRYFKELITSLSNFNNISCVFPSFFSENIYHENLKVHIEPTYKWITILLNKILHSESKIKNSIIHRYNRISSIRKIKKNDFDVFHPTYYEPYFIDACNKPFVITVHDLIHEKFPNYFTEKSFLTDKKRILNSASRLIAISESTKNDLIEIYGILESKIDVIHHGINSSFAETQISSSISKYVNEFQTKKYILYVGARWFYKDFYFFIKSCLQILLENSEISIVCTGASFNNEEIKFLKEINVSKRVFHINANDIELNFIYKNAIFFVYPSTYEGFGMPILEAFSAGCPCLLSDIDVFKEVASDSAQYYKCSDEKDFIDKANLLLTDSKLRNEFILKGYIRVKEFSWEKTAQKTLETYQKAIK